MAVNYIVGNSGFIQCGSADTMLQENAASSISVWVYPTGDGGGNFGRIISKGTGGTGGDVFFIMGSGNALNFRVNGGTQLVRASSTLVVTRNDWNHVLCTWDGSTTASNVHIYVARALNNWISTEVLYNTTTNGATPTNNANNIIRIGNNQTGSRTFDGKINELAVWTSVLSTQERLLLGISKIKRIPLQVSPSTLVAYWPLDESPDGVVSDTPDMFRDLTGNGNNGNPTNFAGGTQPLGAAEEVLSYA